VSRATRAGAPAIAIVLDLEPAIVHERARGRTTRRVDAAVIERQLAAVRRTVDAGDLAGDGFRSVVVLRTPAEIDGLEISRDA
jgi:hypothetical protein